MAVLRIYGIIFFFKNIQTHMDRCKTNSSTPILNSIADIWNIGEQGSSAQVTLYSDQARGDTLIQFLVDVCV